MELNDDKKKRLSEIVARLNEISQDIIQVSMGAVIPDIEDKRAEFKRIHNELRLLIGKQPREYN